MNRYLYSVSPLILSALLLAQAFPVEAGAHNLSAVMRSGEASSPFPTDEKHPGQKVDDERLAAQLERAAAERAARGEFSGVVLLEHGGRVLLEKAYGFADRQAKRPNRIGTRFNIASLGKMFTAVAIARLVDDGKLDYDVPVGRYLPEFPNKEIREQVSVHHLLTHTSGIPDLPDALFISPPARLHGYLPHFSAAKLEFTPGAKRAYSNAGFVLLGLIIERVSGQPYRRFVERTVFGPSGMKSVAWSGAGGGPRDPAIGYKRLGSTDSPDSGWVPNRGLAPLSAGPHGGQFCTASDLARFFRALRSGRLTSRASAETLTTPRRGSGSAYGFGVLSFALDRLAGHSGGAAGASADAYTYWKSSYTIVVLSNFSPPASHEVAGVARALLEPQFEPTRQSRP